MALIHLASTSTVEEAADCIGEHGYAIIDRLASTEAMDRIETELAPFFESTPFGPDDINGRLTKRTGCLVARSPTARDLIMNALVLGVAGKVLARAGGRFRLSLTEVISLWPGSKSQFIHRDELAFGAFPFPVDYDVQLSTLWALTDYTEEMGATRVAPDSHVLGNNVKFGVKDTLAAEMPRGSILMYTGKLYHGSGENRSQRIRRAINIDYAAAWLRQEENQYLACPVETCRTLPHDLLRLMGYETCDALGRVDGLRDPLSVLFGEVRPPISLDESIPDKVYTATAAGPRT
jgi:ectoine hydroxylase-related dioxygenase (phytanoyl-CoA dioxygenase family)